LIVREGNLGFLPPIGRDGRAAGRASPETPGGEHQKIRLSGAGVTGSWVRLRLDVEHFDRDAFTPAVDRCHRDGIDFTSIAALGDVESTVSR